MPRVNPEALRALIFAMGFSQSAFAVEAGIKPSHLSNVLARRRGVSPEALKRMAVTLRVPTVALLLVEQADEIEKASA